MMSDYGKLVMSDEMMIIFLSESQYDDDDDAELTMPYFDNDDN